MKVPRDLSGRALARLLERHYEYNITRQSGSHMRLTTTMGGEHHLTVPDHAVLKPGTLSAILAEVANHQAVDRSEVMTILFGR